MFIKKIIQVEIQNFDFLSNDKYYNDSNIIKLLNDNQFQKQFICDSLIYSKKYKKIKVIDDYIYIGGDYYEEPDEASHITIDYETSIEYKYDDTNKPIKFKLYFQSDNVSITKWEHKESYSYGISPPDYSAGLSYVDWNSIDVSLLSDDGDEIEFTEFNKAPNKIKELFIRQYVEDIISKEIELEIYTYNDTKLNNISYC